MKLFFGLSGFFFFSSQKSVFRVSYGALSYSSERFSGGPLEGMRLIPCVHKQQQQQKEGEIDRKGGESV